MIRVGTVTRYSTAGMWVVIPELGGYELGPFPTLRATFDKGTRVALAQVTDGSDRYIVLGPTEGAGYALFGEGGVGSTAIVPESYGAVGNGTTDDQAALEECFAAAGPGDTILLTGNYAHSGVLVLANDEVTVTGGGTLTSTVPATSAVQVTGDGVTLDKVNFAAENVTVRLGAAEDYQCYVTGDRFVARGCTFGGGPSASVLFEQAHDFHVSDCRITGGLADGFHVTDGSTRGYFVDCVTVTTGDDGFAVVGYEGDGQPGQVTIHDCRVEGGDARGIGLVGCADVIVTDCVVSDTVSAGVYIGCEPSYSTYAASNVYLDRVRVYGANTGAPDPDHSAFFVYSGRVGYVNDGITLHECEAWNTDAAASAIYRQVVDTSCSPATNFRIENCYANGTGCTTPWVGDEPDFRQITYLDVAPASGLGRILTPEAYGAVGNGVADDQAALEAVLSDANPGDVVALTATYSHSDTLIVLDGLTLTGGGTLTGTDETQCCLDVQGDGVVIQNLTVECSGITTQQGTGAASLILVNGAADVVIRDVTAQSAPAHGVLVAAASGTLIDHVTIATTWNCGVFIEGASHDVLVRDTTVTSPGNIGVYAYGGDDQPSSLTFQRVTVNGSDNAGFSFAGCASAALDTCVSDTSGGAGVYVGTTTGNSVYVVAERCLVRAACSVTAHASYFTYSPTNGDDVTAIFRDCDSWNLDADCASHYRGVEENGGTLSVRYERCRANGTGPTETVSGFTPLWSDVVYGDRLAPHLNVRAYGAVGDGTTDDTDAFTTAITAAKAAGMPLYVPPGDYKITEALALSDGGNRLVGASADSTSIVQYGTDVPVMVVEGAQNLVSNLTLSQDALPDSTGDSGHHGENAIELDHVSHSVFEFLRLDTVAYGIVLTDDVANWAFSNTFRDLDILNTYAGAIRIAHASSGSTGNVFSNVYCNGSHLATADYAVYFRSLQESVVDQLNIEGYEEASTLILVQNAGVVFNSLHFEQNTLSGYAPNLLRIYSGCNVTANLVTVQGCDMGIAGTTGNPSIFSLGEDGTVFRVAGLRITQNEVTSASVCYLASGDDIDATDCEVAIDGVWINAGDDDCTWEDTNGAVPGLVSVRGVPQLPAWQSFDPDWQCGDWTLGNGTQSGVAALIGSTCHFRAEVTFGSTSTFGTWGGFQFALPYEAEDVRAIELVASFRDDSTGNVYVAPCWNEYTTTFEVRALGTSGQITATSATAPFTWAASDSIYVAGTYEVAL